MSCRYWLMKSDPETFSFDDLKTSPGQTTCWDGVRNFQARNYLRDEIRVGDGVLFYHSQSDPPEVVGTARVVRAGYPDPSQFDPRSRHHDPDSDPAEPRWYAVDIRLEREFPRPVPLGEMRRAPALGGMALLRKGSRLSIQPVTAEEWGAIRKLAARPKPAR